MKHFSFLLLGGLLLSACANTNNNFQGSGVNAFLWRASLETLSFMPLASADSTGGVIITEWQEQKAGERIKLNVAILASDLRVDSIQVSVFRQVKRQGRWQTALVNKKTALAIENLILTKARALRLGYGQ